MNPHFFEFLFRLADNYRPFAHTEKEKGSAMGVNLKQQKQGAARFQYPCFPADPHPPMCFRLFLASLFCVTNALSII